MLKIYKNHLLCKVVWLLYITNIISLMCGRGTPGGIEKITVITLIARVAAPTYLPYTFQRPPYICVRFNITFFYIQNLLDNLNNTRIYKHHRERNYQIRHLCCGFIFESAGQLNAAENSGLLERGPRTRNLHTKYLTS